MLKWILLISILWLTACQPQPADNESSSSSSSSNNTFADLWGDSGSNSSSGSSDSGNNYNDESTLSHELKWYSNGSYSSAVTLDSTFTDMIYLRGNEVNNYLKSSYASVCLTISFSASGSNPLKVRLIPYTLGNSIVGIERVFRLNFNDKSGNQAACDDVGVVYSLAEVCPSCSGKIGANYLSFSDGNFNEGSLDFWVNMNNDTTTPTNTCTNQSCQASGFDCCLEGQCVKNATTKQSAIDNDPDTFAQIQVLLQSNPNAYADYPEFYYICPGMTPVPGDNGSGDDGNDPVSNANVAFEKLKADYLCVTEMKTKATDSPFHAYPYNEEEDYEYCDVEDEEAENHYGKVLERLYTNCGCSETSVEAAIQNCPNYEYKVKSTDAQGEPTEIICYAPPIVVDQPFQDLNVNVSSRTAPHRYFDSEGTNYDHLGALIGNTEVSQEGDPFLYQDQEKTMPVNGSFNMNSILGPMNITLDATLPAKVVNLDIDKVYIIGTTSGYYTPCPSCARDSWFSPFTSIPTTSYGSGLRAVGYTTSRYAWGENSTYGNYEDTIFGRACWLPPTMLPYSHNAGDDAQSQRLARLQTQAAMYVNGYQRDWFGFNKGALIGSFDGVSWFAVGTGRIVRAKSNKLFLAINAPFADIAEPTYHVVSVQLFSGIGTAAQYDYNPNVSNNSPYQNSAGTCQSYHKCDTDRDCVTKLGWEYVCADVTGQSTQWPVFDDDGNEVDGESQTRLIEQILVQGSLPTGSTKRCVYRGAGAPCRKDYESIEGENKRKIMACAPNFYCAGFEDEVFNVEVARFTGPLENLPVAKNHLFGQDANQLGRPLHYFTGSNLEALPAEAGENLTANIEILDEGAGGNEGLCRPGRALPDEDDAESDLAQFHNQHQAVDENGRTDYISQIGGCNTEITSAVKYLSCPVFDENGNYIYGYATDAEAVTENLELGEDDEPMQVLLSLAKAQNSCGGETLSEDDNSPFRFIEALALPETPVIVENTLAKSACFRRAGSICHTDLDCSPGKLHGQQAGVFGVDHFGNIAEQKYWEEYLVCGQADPKPGIYDANYPTYDMTKNVCCREVGKDLTIYSEKTIGLEGTDELSTTTFGFAAPNDATRYSRFAITNNLGEGVSGSKETDGDAPHMLTKNQWKAISDVAGKTCCGGGWVRKFADGTNDWAITTRLSFDVSNFRCLNYQSEIANATAEILEANNINSGTYYGQYNRLCSGPGDQEGEGGCMETGINRSGTGLDIVYPTAGSEATGITLKTWSFMGTHWMPYMPITADGNPEVIIDITNEGPEPRKRKTSLPFVIPAYMDHEKINTITANRASAGSQVHICAESGSGSGCDLSYTAQGGNKCSYCINPDSSYGALLVIAINEGTFYDAAETNKEDVGFLIDFDAPGSSNRANPGNYLYYLQKLGNFELIGVPQIHFEPILCNDNRNNLVPGLFDAGITTISEFSEHELAIDGSSVVSSNDQLNGDQKAAAADMLAIDPVFSSHEFKCCVQLGKEAPSADVCCSGAAAQNKTTKKLECKLPKGTDLNVYFNRFISSEGVGDEQPGGGFKEDEFLAGTGEPDYTREDVIQKLYALGTAYCASGKSVKGGAFGNFKPEPSNGNVQTTNISIVDSTNDSGQSSSSTGDGSGSPTGYSQFSQGYRWNHHIYCQ